MRTLEAVALVVALSLTACSSGVEKDAEEDDGIVYLYSYVEYASVADLTASSTSVIEGTIVSSSCQWIDLGGVPAAPSDSDTNPGLDDATVNGIATDAPILYTLYSVEVTAVIEGGHAVGDEVAIRQLGCELDGVEARLEGVVELKEGRTYVFYVVEWHDGTASLVNQSQSVYLKNDDGTLTPTDDRNSLADEVLEDLASRGIGRLAAR